jgi:PhzF family phenazine biosynthesis protein
MGQRIVQVDAFADRPFSGNPAAVVLLERPADEVWMRNVALEMNLAETAFLVRRGDGDFDLRWFTPAVEVDLCGHATLASAHVLWEDGHLPTGAQARFHTRSGLLTADRRDGSILLDFPATTAQVVEPPSGLIEALGVRAAYVGKSAFDYLVEVDSEAAVRALTPDFGKLAALGGRGIIVTARASSPGFDFVSRFFAPGAGIDEDPVTGSAHTTLGPFWAPRLGKTSFVAYQASSRGGVVEVELAGDRVLLGGQAVTVLRGELVDDVA